jgi:hypothetical protein
MAQAKRQPFVSEQSLRRQLAEALKAGNVVAIMMLTRAVDQIEGRRQWRRWRQ